MVALAPRRIRQFAAVTALAWTTALAASLVWDVRLLDDQTEALARFQAQGAFDRDTSYRLWSASLGGVYADATRVAPNPHLTVDHRDIDTEAGPLTLVNPAYMTRMVHAIAAETTGVVSHITSLDPVRPENAAAPWEAAALRRFEDGVSEYAAVAEDPDGTAWMRFMRPLMVEEPCLKCHADQGYEVGEVRGGISVTVPMAPIAAILAPTRARTIIGHVVIWVIGVAGLALAAWGLIRLTSQIEAARQRAQVADAAKSQFLAAMSHELRTPLNAILGFSQVMEQNIFGPLGHEKYQDYTHDMRRSGEHLLSLINDVLDLAKIEAGKTTLVDEPLCLPTLIRDVVTLLRDQAQRADVRLDHVIDPALPGLIADRRTVHQMLLNLLGNALRFTPSGGRITVAASLDEDDGLVLAVRDTGVGIPPEELKHVLEPFGQSSVARQRGDAGTGLGLSLVKAFIECHDGQIDLSSRVGSGTTVILRFPPWRTTRSAARDAEARRIPVDPASPPT